MAEEQETKFTTYLEVADKLIKENPDFYTKDQLEGLMSFAKYLDSFKSIGNELQLLALQQARKIDRELILACCDEFGRDKVAALAKIVTARHRHHKVWIEDEGTSEVAK